MSCLLSVRQDAERSLRQRRGVRREGQLQHRFPWCPLTAVLTQAFRLLATLPARGSLHPCLAFFSLSPATSLALSLQVPAQQPLLCMSASHARGGLHACAFVQISRRNQAWPAALWSTEGKGRPGRWDGSDETLGIAEQPFP